MAQSQFWETERAKRILQETIQPSVINEEPNTVYADETKNTTQNNVMPTRETTIPDGELQPQIPPLSENKTTKKRTTKLKKKSVPKENKKTRGRNKIPIKQRVGVGNPCDIPERCKNNNCVNGICVDKRRKKKGIAVPNNNVNVEGVPPPPPPPPEMTEKKNRRTMTEMNRTNNDDDNKNETGFLSTIRNTIQNTLMPIYGYLPL